MIELFGGVCQICHDHHMFLSSMLCTSTHLTHPNLWKVIFNAPSNIHFSCPTRPPRPPIPRPTLPAPNLFGRTLDILILTKSKAITKKFARNPLCNIYVGHTLHYCRRLREIYVAFSLGQFHIEGASVWLNCGRSATWWNCAEMLSGLLFMMMWVLNEQLTLMFKVQVHE